MIKKENYVVLEGEASTWQEAIQLCGDALYKQGVCGIDFSDSCITREYEYPTGLPSTIPVAIPHATSDGIQENGVCFLRLATPVSFQRMDNGDEWIETRLIFNLAMKDSGEHIQFLQKFMAFLMDDEVIQQCLLLDIDKVRDYLKEKLEM